MSKATKQAVANRKRRHVRIRKTVKGTEVRPRIAVFKSNRYLAVQVIDDVKEVTLIGATTAPATATVKEVEKLAQTVASAMKKANLNQAVFDRGGFSYAGKIAAFAETLRQEGIEF